MPSTTVRISDDTRELLGELATQEGVTMQAILDKALEMYRRQRFLDAVNDAYAALHQDPDAWQGLQQERAAWDATLADGLDREETWTDTGEMRRADHETSTP
jgi:hypothetical protein